MLTSFLKRERVTRALSDAEVLDWFDFGWKELVADGMSFALDREVVTRVLRRIGIDEAIVPGDFPLALGDHLRDEGIALTVDDDAVELRRRAKAGGVGLVAVAPARGERRRPRHDRRACGREACRQGSRAPAGMKECVVSVW